MRHFLLLSGLAAGAVFSIASNALASNNKAKSAATQIQSIKQAYPKGKSGPDLFAGWHTLEMTESTISAKSILKIRLPAFLPMNFSCEVTKHEKDLHKCGNHYQEVSFFGMDPDNDKRYLDVRIVVATKTSEFTDRKNIGEIQKASWGNDVKDYRKIKIDGHPAHELFVADHRMGEKSMLHYARIVYFRYKHIDGVITFSEGNGENENPMSTPVPFAEWKLGGLVDKIISSIKFTRKVEE